MDKDYIQLLKDNESHKQNLKNMKDTNLRIEKKLDKFMEEIRANMPSKKDVEQHSIDIIGLKAFRENVNTKIAIVTAVFGIVAFLLNKYL